MKYKCKLFSTIYAMVLISTELISGMDENFPKSNSCPSLDKVVLAQRRAKLKSGSSQEGQFVLPKLRLNSADGNRGSSIPRPGSPSFRLEPKEIPGPQAQRNKSLFDIIDKTQNAENEDQKIENIKTQLMQQRIVNSEEKASRIAQIAARITIKAIPEHREFKSDKIYKIWLARHPADETNDKTDIHETGEETNLSRAPSQIADIKQFWLFRDMFGDYFQWFSSPTLRAFTLVEKFAKIIVGLKEQNIGIKPEQMEKRLLQQMLIDPLHWLNDSDGECGLEVIARWVEDLDIIFKSLEESGKSYAYAVTHRLPIYWTMFYYFGGQLIPGSCFPNLGAIVLLVDAVNREFKIMMEPTLQIPRVLMPFEYGKYFQRLQPDFQPIIKDDDVDRLRLQEMSAKCQLDAFSKRSS